MPVTLTPEEKDKLKKEMIKYASEGATDDQLRQFRDAFISQLKKKDPSEAASGQDSSAPQKPSTPSFGQQIVDKTLTQEIQVPLRGQQEKPSQKRPYQDIYYKQKELPSETIQQVAFGYDREIPDIEEESESLSSQISKGNVPPKPKNPVLRAIYTPDRIAQEVNESRKSLGIDKTVEEEQNEFGRNFYYNSLILDYQDELDDYSSLAGDDAVNYLSDDAMWASGNHPDLVALTKEGQANINDPLQQKSSEKQGEFHNKVMDSYWQYMSKKYPDGFALAKDKYEKLKSKSESNRLTKDEEFLLQLEERAYGLLNARLAKNMKDETNQIAEYSKVIGSADVKGYTDGMKELNKSAELLKAQYESGAIDYDKYSAEISNVQQKYKSLETKTMVTDRVREAIEKTFELQSKIGSQSQILSASSKVMKNQLASYTSIQQEYAEKERNERLRQEFWDSDPNIFAKAMVGGYEFSRAMGQASSSMLVSAAASTYKMASALSPVSQALTKSDKYDITDMGFDAIMNLQTNMISNTIDQDTNSTIANIANMAGNGIGSSLTFLLGGQAAMFMKAPKWLGTFLPAYLSAEADIYDKLVNSGKYSALESSVVSTAVAIPSAAIEILVPEIPAAKGATKTLTQTVLDGGPIGLALKNSIESYATNIGKEGAEEGLAYLADYGTKNLVNYIGRQKYLEDEFSSKELQNGILGGMLVGGIMNKFRQGGKKKSPVSESAEYEIVKRGQDILDSHKSESTLGDLRSALKKPMETLSSLEQHPNWNSLDETKRAHVFSITQDIDQLESSKIQDPVVKAQVEKLKIERNEILSLGSNGIDARSVGTATVPQRVMVAGNATPDQTREIEVLDKKKAQYVTPRVAQIMSEGKLSKEQASAIAEKEWNNTEDGKKRARLESATGAEQAFFFINEDGDYELQYNNGRSVVISKGEGAADKIRSMGVVVDTGEVSGMVRENQNTLITPKLERGATIDYNGRNATINSFKEKDGKVVYVNATTEDGRNLQIREGQQGPGQELLNNLNNLQYDQENQVRISGEPGVGQESTQAQPIESAGAETTEAGSVGVGGDVESNTNERVVYDREPTADDGVYKILGDENNIIYRVNPNTGRIQEYSNGLWSNTASNAIARGTARKQGFQKIKDPSKSEQSLKETPKSGSVVGGEVEATAKALEGKNPEKLIPLFDVLGEVQSSEFNKQQAIDVINTEIDMLPDDIKFAKDKERQLQLKERLDYLSDTKNKEKEIENLFKELEKDSSEKLANSNKKVSEAYHKAKADGSNPELVKAVEQSLKETPVSKTDEKIDTTAEQVDKADMTQEPRSQTEPVQETGTEAEGEQTDTAKGPERRRKRNILAKLRPSTQTKEAVAEWIQMTPEQREATVVEKVSKGLSEAGVEVTVLDDADYENEMGKQGQDRKSEGMFWGDDGKIYFKRSKIRDEKWGRTLAFHEGSHPIVNIIRNTDPKRYRQIVEGINRIVKDNPKLKSLGSIVAFSQSEIYKGNEAAMEDELVVEFFARVTSGELDLSSIKVERGLKEKVIDFINSILKKIGVSPIKYNASDEVLREAAQQVSNLFNAGGNLSDVVGKENVSKFQNDLFQPRITAGEVLSQERTEQKKVTEVADAFEKAVDNVLDPSSDPGSRVTRFLENAYEDLRYFFSEYSGDTGLDWYTNKVKEFDAKLRELSDIAISRGEMGKENSLSNGDNMNLFRVVLALSSIGVNPRENVKAAFSIWKTFDQNTKTFSKYQPGQVSVRTNIDDGKGGYLAPSGTIEKETNSFIDIRQANGKVIRVKKSDLAKEFDVTYRDKNGNEKVIKGTRLFKASPVNTIFRKGNQMVKIPNEDILDQTETDNGIKGKGWTTKGNVVVINLERVERLLASTPDVKDAINWLNSKHPVAELRQYNPSLADVEGGKGKVNPKGERIGSYIIGEKLGAFHQNVAGTPSELTMDLWWSRTWNRYMGTLMITDEKGEPAIQETPRTDAERNIMREAAAQAANSLGLEVHELQAALWYLEQQVYKRMGAAVESYSFVDGVNQLLLKHGKTNEEIQPERYGVDNSETEKRREDAATRAANILYGNGGKKGAAKVKRSSPLTTGQASASRGDNLVENTYYESGLTEDGGDYVFFHVSPAPKSSIAKGIDSTKNTSLRTSREEKGLQYGVASYYTRPEDGERMVGGEKYAVRVPKGKVYPIDSDPLDYTSAAERKIKEGTPYRAEAIKREIANSAKKDGYEMIVGEWSYSRAGNKKSEIPEFRADALIPLKPTSETADQFESNESKGMERIPFPEQDQIRANEGLRNIASEVRDEMSRKKKYSSKQAEIANDIFYTGQIREYDEDGEESLRDITEREYTEMIKGLPKAMKADGERVKGMLFGGGQASASRLDPLDGAPTPQGAAGPDPSLVSVAEEYAKANGIPYRRQGEYVSVDEDRAKRIAQAYDEMEHDPRDPEVKEAYANLIQQTRKQYDALVDAGYEFSFFGNDTDPYKGNPVDAMRDLRKNKKMAVYETEAGYGTEGITKKERDENPMLEDTGLMWPDQGGEMKPVVANDLFRAVHDAFGHGLEGAGFRARGEENAWQAHVRLFTGSAIAAITTETRGQNSWLNYGPYGEKNKKAKIEDTVFAEQKTGLMPSWTWEEGVAPDTSAQASASREDADSLLEDGLDKLEDAVDSGMDPQEAIDKFIGNQDWYADLSPQDKSKLNELLTEEYGASVTEKNSVDKKAEKIASLWATGDRQSKKLIADILEDEPELSYIYANYPKILAQLESAGLITKTDGCP